MLLHLGQQNISSIPLRVLVDKPMDLRQIVGLDSAEAAARLARHAMGEIRRELGDGEESADAQASRVNALLHGLAPTDAGASVALPARVLQGIRARSPLGDLLPLPPLPATNYLPQIARKGEW